MSKRLLNMVLVFSMSLSLHAQLEPLLDLHQVDALAINPAYAGSQEALNVGLHTRNQWVGFTGAPSTYSLSVHSPLRNKNTNLGLVLLADKLGSQQEMGVLVNYAHRIQLGKGKLSLGLAAGLSGFSTDVSSLVSLDQGDQVVLDPIDRLTLPEFSVGAYYYQDDFFIGLSLPYFLSHYSSGESSGYKTGFDPRESNYMLSAGYVFNLSENLDLFPLVLVQSSPANITRFDAQCQLILKQRFWLGAGIRSTGNLSALFQVQLNPQLRIAYSYGYEFSELSSYQNGSHELLLQYNFRYILDVFSPRYF